MLQSGLAWLRSVALGTTALEITTTRKWLKGEVMLVHPRRGDHLIIKINVRNTLSIAIFYLASLHA